MALVKVHGVKETPYNNLRYITNAEKTNHGMLVDGINTFSDPKKAAHDMLNYREQYSIKRKNQVFHILHSFNGKDKLDPVTAHEISLRWASEVFPKDSMYVMATHTNTQNLHTHFTINSCCKDGSSLSFSSAWHEKATEVSNRLCREYGLINSIIKQKPSRSQYKHYKEYMAHKKGNSFKDTIRKDIDLMIVKSNSTEDFFTSLNAKGYTFKEGKSGLMIKHQDQERFISMHRLGAGYSKYALENRINLLNSIPKLRRIREEKINILTDVLHEMTINGDVKQKQKELQKEFFSIYKSDNPVDKTRCKEIKMETNHLKKIEDFMNKYKEERSLNEVINEAERKSSKQTIKKEREEIER